MMRAGPSFIANLGVPSGIPAQDAITAQGTPLFANPNRTTNPSLRFGADDHNIGAINPLAGSAVLDCRDSAKKYFTEYETSPPLPNFRYHATLMLHKRFDTIRAGAPHRQGTRTVMLDPDVKQRVIEEYRTHETDTGSTELQVAMLTERIRQVTDHLRT
ncbi:MAG: 30S ribosomal protein S15, partial [Boseongicola sp.]|nr:30S ribosomal protein S15 [Boseongicola sp.]